MAEPAPEKVNEQKTEVVNPVLPPDYVQGSKNIFNQAMKDVQEASSPIENDVTAPPPPAKPQQQEPPKAEEVHKAEPEGAKPKDKPVLPEEIFTPADEEKLGEKPDEAIAEIDSMELPKAAKPETVKSFNEFRERTKKHLVSSQEKIAELERKLSEASKNGDAEGWQKKISEAEKRRQEIEDRFARVAYEQSPKFQAQFIEREKAALEGAKSSLEGTEVNPGLIDAAAHSSPANRIKMLREAGAEPEIISAVVGYLAHFDGIQREKGKAIENWRTEAAREQEANQTAQQQAVAKRKAEEDRIWNNVTSKMDLIPLRKAKDNAEWNTRAETLKQQAKQIYNGDGVTFDELSETILKGKAYDALNEVVNQLIEQNKNLRSENGKIKAAKPGGEMTQSTTASPTKDHSKISQEESAKSIFNEQMAAFGATTS